MRTEIDAAHVLSSYLGLLANARNSVPRDENELPYPKGVIKQVLMHCIKLDGEGKEQELLRSAYVNLADFQALSNDELQSLKVWNSVNAEDPRRMSDRKVLDAAKRLSEGGDAAQEVIRRIATEAATLLEELEREGL